MQWSSCQVTTATSEQGPEVSVLGRTRREGHASPVPLRWCRQPVVSEEAGIREVLARGFGGHSIPAVADGEQRGDRPGRHAEQEVDGLAEAA